MELLEDTSILSMFLMLVLLVRKEKKKEKKKKQPSKPEKKIFFNKIKSLGKRHVGDMGNFKSNSNGEILALFSNELASLTANDDASIIGRSIVIHQSSDDCISQPSG